MAAGENLKNVATESCSECSVQLILVTLFVMFKISVTKSLEDLLPHCLVLFVHVVISLNRHDNVFLTHRKLYKHATVLLYKHEIDLQGIHIVCYEAIFKQRQTNHWLASHTCVADILYISLFCAVYSRVLMLPLSHPHTNTFCQVPNRKRARFQSTCLPREINPADPAATRP